MNTPVLLITFRRPDTTAKVFRMIRQIRPTHLFIASDGPRPAVPGETELVESCRAMLHKNNIDWDCNVTYYFENTNLGCARMVTSAIDRAFEVVDKLIILEDDVIPHIDFFAFCTAMLTKYADNEQIMHVSGTRWNEEYGKILADHYVSTVGHIWGWATWKRAWKRYDINITTFPELRARNILLTRFKSRKISQYWHARFNEVYGMPKKITWDYQWQFSLFKYAGLAVVPNVNLVSNIGLTGEHSDGSPSNHHFRPVKNWRPISDIEPALEIDINFEKYHMRDRFLKKQPLLLRLQNRIRIILNSLS